MSASNPEANVAMAGHRRSCLRDPGGDVRCGVRILIIGDGLALPCGAHQSREAASQTRNRPCGVILLDASHHRCVARVQPRGWLDEQPRQLPCGRQWSFARPLRCTGPRKEGLRPDRTGLVRCSATKRCTCRLPCAPIYANIGSRATGRWRSRSPRRSVPPGTRRADQAGPARHREATAPGTLRRWHLRTVARARPRARAIASRGSPPACRRRTSS